MGKRKTKSTRRTACDYASEIDRVWFERHPGEYEYVRRCVPGEFTPGATPLGEPRTGPPAFVRVTQIQPGFRVRQSITGIGVPET